MAFECKIFSLMGVLVLGLSGKVIGVQEGEASQSDT